MVYAGFLEILSVLVQVACRVLADDVSNLDILWVHQVVYDV